MPDSRPLPAGEVHVWEIALGAAPAEAERILSPDERARAARLRTPADRARWMAARCALRAVLAGYLDAEPAAVRFRYAAHGKPALDAPWDQSGLHFNHTHSGGRMLIGVAHGGRVGIDLEQVRPVSHMGRVARRLFSADELARWEALPEDKRLPEFFRLWARLEAAAKLTGEGVWRTVRLGIRTPGAVVHDLEAGDGWVAAVAAEHARTVRRVGG